MVDSSGYGITTDSNSHLNISNNVISGNYITDTRQYQVRGLFVVIDDKSKIGEGTVIWNFVNIYTSTIGTDCKIASHVEIGGSEIGDGCKIEAFAFIPPGVTIGDNVFVGPHVKFGNDKYPNADPVWKRGNVVIENNVSIGLGAIILPGVTIGRNSFIAAGSIVTKDVGKDMFAMGQPAHAVHKSIFEKTGGKQ